MNQYLKGSDCTLWGSAPAWSREDSVQWVMDGDEQTVWHRAGRRDKPRGADREEYEERRLTIQPGS